ncbi:adenylate/guanylate cyclase domain-containing protein [Spirulina sp. 06S082]|uniref:adenylate/guanylate cyclase domain-containing protein n=1 Tax=Spirulina sp. 06S082 TaxID=3110248 RepID=UPI002B1EB6FA|nr:adenylate/guanylate cyclase domain-containing protein [Spirulina sp. 06S082]MEA5467941.1 adenylate/guanylate cyclase domain-containing protein [Spirulina sp. 06S082]
MSSQAFISRTIGRIPLRLVLIVPFVLQILAAVGLTGWLSLQNGQVAIQSLASQLQGEVTARIAQNLNEYLAIPKIVNQSAVNILDPRAIAPTDNPNIQRYFWKQVKSIAIINTIQFATEGEKYIGAGRTSEGDIVLKIADPVTTGSEFQTYATNTQGQPTAKLSARPNYNPRSRPWYQAAIRVNQPVWSSVYVMFSHKKLGMTLSQPLYEDAGKFLGVVGTDILLEDISSFLENIQIGQRGQTLIIDRQGNTVASSTREALFSERNGSARRVKIGDSTNAIVQATGRYLQSYFGDLSKIQKNQQLYFTFEGKRYFFQVSPIAEEFGLDWLILVVVPEDDFLGQIHANTRITVILCFLAFALAIASGILTARWITKPVLELSRASQAITAGRLEQKIQIQPLLPWCPGIAEIRVLAKSFNRMAVQLRQSFHDLETAKVELEERVQERTAQLATAESELRGVFAAMTELILIFDRQGRYLKIPSANRELLYNAEEIVVGKTIHEIFPQAQADWFVAQIESVLDQRGAKAIEYAIPLEGQETWFSATISPISEDSVVWVARNVSERKLLEQQLRTSEEKMRMVFEAMTSIILVLTLRDGNLENLEISPTSPARLYHETDMDPIGETIAGFYSEETASQWLESINYAIESQQLVNLDYKLQFADREIWFSASISPLSTDSAIWVARDITDRKHAEEEIELLLTVGQEISAAKDFDSAIAILLQRIGETTGWNYGEAWIPAVDGSALVCSPSWYSSMKDEGTDNTQQATGNNISEFREYSEALTLLANEELPGRVWVQCRPEWVRDVSLEADDVFLRLEKAAECGLNSAFAVPILIPPREDLLRESERLPVLAVLTFFLTDTCRQDEQAFELVMGVAGQLGTLLQQKQDEAELKALFAAMTDLIFVFDGNGRHLKIPVTNAKNLIYDPMTNRIGKTLHEIFPEEQATFFLALIRETLQKQDNVEVEYSLQIEGEEIWSDTTISPISTDSVIWVARDITDRKQAEAALLKRQRYSAIVVEVQRQLLAASAGSDNYHTILEPLGRVSGASRVYLFENSRDRDGILLMSQKAEWCGEGVIPELDNPDLQNLAYRDSFPRWESVLEQGHYIEGIVTEFPPEERDILEPQGVLALLVLPIVVNGEFFGFIGFDNCYRAKRWDASEIDLLRAVAAAMGLWQERRRAVKALRQKAERDNLLGEISRQFIDGDLDAAINFALEAIAQMLDSDRAYILRYRESGKRRRFSMTHEWCREGVIPAIAELQKIPAEHFPWFFEQYQAGNIVQFTHLDELPVEAVAERAEMVRESILSGLQIPTNYGGKMVGTIGLDAVRSHQAWNAEDVRFLQLVGDAIASARVRHDAEQALRIEQEKSERLLLNILPAPIAERLKQNQGSLAEQFNEVSILFADIVGFTPLSTRLSPIELVNLLNHIFSAFDELVDRLGLEKIKTIGDAYMVAGGLPIPRTDHAEAIAEMALLMQEAIREFGQQQAKTLQPGDKIQIRIGINSGVVVAGVIGTKKFIYDLWGDAVNIASRMESSGQPNGIQITESTYVRIKDKFMCEPRGIIKIKGKGEMMTYWLKGKRESC